MLSDGLRIELRPVPDIGRSNNRWFDVQSNRPLSASARQADFANLGVLDKTVGERMHVTKGMDVWLSPS